MQFEGVINPGNGFFLLTIPIKGSLIPDAVAANRQQTDSLSWPV